MDTTAVEKPAEYGLRTLPTICGLQNEAFERMQKLTHLNVAALKAMLEEGQATLLSSSKSALPPVYGAVALSQHFAEHALSYCAHVREIDAQFMAAVTRAGEVLRNQYSVIWTGIAANLPHTAPFGSDTAAATMQSAISAMMQITGMTQQTVSRAADIQTPPLPVSEIA